MAASLIVPLAIQAGLIIGVSALFATFFRAARVAGGRPAAGVAGGLIAGLLLGPAVLGRAAPAWHERIFVGGSAERAGLEAIRYRHAADRLALSASGATEVALDELARAHDAEAGPALETWRAATGRHAASSAAAFSALAAFLLAAGGFAGWPGRSARRSDPWSLAAHGLSGVFGAVVAAGVTALVLRWWFDTPLDRGLAVGAAAAGGTAFAGVPLRWLGEAGRTPSSWACGVGLLGGAVVVMAGSMAPDRPAWSVVAPAAYGAGLILGQVARPGPRTRRLASRILTGWATPALAAWLAACLREPDSGLSWGMAAYVAFALLTSGDGQAIGTWLGINTLAPQRDRARAASRTTELIASGVGPTVLALAVIAVGAGVLDLSRRDGAAALAGLLANALLIEMLTPVNRRLLRLERAVPGAG